MSRPAFPAAPLARATGVGGLVLLLVVTLAHPSATRMHTWPWALATALLWLLPIGFFFTSLGGTTTWRLPNRWITAGALLLSVSAIASAWLSPFSSASLARVWPTLGGTAFLLWLHHWLSAPAKGGIPRAFRLMQIILAGGAVLVVASVGGFLLEALRTTWA